MFVWHPIKKIFCRNIPALISSDDVYFLYAWQESGASVDPIFEGLNYYAMETNGVFDLQ